MAVGLLDRKAVANLRRLRYISFGVPGFEQILLLDVFLKIVYSTVLFIPSAL